MKYKNKRISGFTLIELLVTIAVLTIVVSLLYNVSSAFSEKLASDSSLEFVKSETDRLLEDISADFEEIILKDKQQPIFESQTTDKSIRFIFFTAHSKNQTTSAVLYNFTKSNNVYIASRQEISNKDSLNFQLKLTPDSNLLEEFTKFKSSTSHYKLCIKTLKINLININNKKETIFDLLSDTCILKNHIYTKSNNETSSKILTKLAIYLDILSIISPTRKLQAADLDSYKFYKKTKHTNILQTFL